ncbi:MAG: hypothetical protein HY812_09330 [Planctomycetes bacterium]|nr:hypothetical protein [Planctomycetota bacterium]
MARCPARAGSDSWRPESGVESTVRVEWIAREERPGGAAPRRRAGSLCAAERERFVAELAGLRPEFDDFQVIVEEYD